MAFDEVLGHELAREGFCRALKRGRIAQGYLLAGPEGVGKGLLARQVAASQASYDEAMEVERAQEVRYRVGATDLRTWLEAQQTRRDAELSLARVRQGQLNNDVTLFKALGGSAG